MSMTRFRPHALLALAVLAVAATAAAQESSIRVQCPDTPKSPYATGVRCAHLSAGDGFATMGDGTPLYVFSFARLPVDGDPGAPGIQPVNPDLMMTQGMLAANIPAPRLEVKEGEEFYLTLTNVGMTLRPDLFDPHSVHWHGFPQAASVFDGLPESGPVINMGASLTYYYLVNEPGTYMYHCHVEASEHMQMGMLGNLYVLPKQDGTPLGSCASGACTKFAYNDGDGSTGYDVAFPVQIGTFDSAFHEASVNVQPLPFASMNDDYFMLNGRGYPDTVRTDCLPPTVHPAGESNGASQCENALVQATAGQKILLRLSNVSTTDFVTIGTNGIRMLVVGKDARLLRGDDGTNQYYRTNSVTLGGGETVDAILETAGLAPGTYFLYANNLHFLSNGRQNFGGAMTEIRIN